MKIEICANSFESASAAQLAGAHRIELCQELALGGVTPSYGLVAKVIEELDIPVFVLIRPRSGDFTYSESEFDVMLRDIAFAKKKGAQGIVSGVLNKNNTIDVARTKKLIAATSGLQFTFHRAFDWTPSTREALDTLIDLGVDRVLTSGKEMSVMEGFGNLKTIYRQANGRIGILPGGGVSLENIVQIQMAGFQEVHGSFSCFRENISHQINMHNTADLENDNLRYSDVKKIEEVLKKIGNSEVGEIR